VEEPNQKQGVPSLLERSRSGDTSAFGALMAMHQQYAYIIAFRILRDEDHAKDVVQEAFLRIWKHLNRYQHSAKFTTWLHTIVVRLCYDRMKSEARRRAVLSRPTRDVKDLPFSRDLEHDVESRDISERILTLAKKLPPKQRLVFMLRDVQDWTIEEISRLAGMSVNTVKANLCYARKVIREGYERLERGTP
jgi:RNA polymerase sigma-70 factor (ECF subfamily)